jgi:hypothetical protein
MNLNVLTKGNFPNPSKSFSLYTIGDHFCNQTFSVDVICDTNDVFRVYFLIFARRSILIWRKIPVICDAALFQ